MALHQDQKGVIWIGSCDGLNVFDGNHIQLYSTLKTSKPLLSGNLITQIAASEKEMLWIQTNYGLDLLDTKSQSSKSFTEFKDNRHFSLTPDNELFTLKDDGYLYQYERHKQDFKKVDIPQMNFENVLSIVIDNNNVMWIFMAGHATQTYQITKTDKGLLLRPNTLFKHTEKLRWAFVEKNIAYFVDETNALYEYDFSNRQQYYIADLKAEIEARGEIKSIIKQQSDYYIGFKSRGLIVLKYMSDQKIKYQIQSTEIHAGIFCLMKDKFQDVVWVGTDGQGVYMCYKDGFAITNTLLDTPVYQINNPVRALYQDPEQTLWIGTKGGGILRIKNYSPGDNTSNSFDRLLSYNSALTDNAVYCFAPGRQNRLWIGTEQGINYYSYLKKELKELAIMADDKKVKYVHAMNELNDSTLWVTTVGEGLVKIIFKEVGGIPVVKSATRIVLDEGRMVSNFFFTSFQESDSILWFGNRGYGAYRLNIETNALTPHRFDNVVNSQTANDIFAIYKNSRGYWLGTSSGLLRFNRNDSDGSYNQVDLLSNNTVHGILEDYQGNLWVSTNQGLIRFNPQSSTGQTYNRSNGLEVTEFSDGAFYRHQRSGTLFFGGTNGFTTVKPNTYTTPEYMPRINLKSLTIFGKEYNINDFLSEKRGVPILELDYNVG